MVVLVGYGLLLCASSSTLSAAVGNDPIGGLATVLPDWFLVPFVLVSVAGLISGAMLDLYSSGLTLLTLGLKTPRFVAAGIDGVLMILGTIYIVWIAADNFLGIFQGFLITLGVPMAAWAGVFLADLLLRQRDYDEAALYSAQGRYAAVGWPAVVLMAVATVIGWGLVAEPYGAKGLGWLGYLLDPLGFDGGKTGTWAVRQPRRPPRPGDRLRRLPGRRCPAGAVAGAGLRVWSRDGSSATPTSRPSPRTLDPDRRVVAVAGVDDGVVGQRQQPGPDRLHDQ